MLVSLSVHPQCRSGCSLATEGVAPASGSCPQCSPNARFMPYDVYCDGVKRHGNISSGTQAGNVVTQLVRASVMNESAQGQSPTQAPSPAEQNKTGFQHLSLCQPFSASATGCATSGINNSYLGCHLKRYLVSQLNWQVATGGSFPVWTMLSSLIAAGNTWARFVLFPFVVVVILQYCPSVKYW